MSENLEYIKRIEVIESIFGKLLSTLESQILMQKQGFDFDIDIYEKKIKDYISQLEESRSKYYDEKTLTHFISDIEDWMESHKTEGVDAGDCWYVEVSELEEFLINRKKQMEKYIEKT